MEYIMNSKHNTFNRRQFLQTSGCAALAAGFLPIGQKEQHKTTSKKAATIKNYHPNMKYRQLGNTDIHFSVISMGGIGLEQAKALYTIDHGVNLIHMSSSYNGGKSIKELGKVLKDKRNKVYIALKDSFGNLDEALRTMNTDYVDFLMFNRHRSRGVTDSKIYKQFEKWKQQGKVRFAGLTTHGDVKACAAAGIESDFYSLIMPTLNQPGLEAMTEELKSAHKKGIGIMAMKTLKGIRKTELQNAFIKKVLNNPAVTTINKDFPSFDLFDMFFKTMQESLSYNEDTSLYRYAQHNRSHNCMMCSECENVCPQQIEISTLLRTKLYYHDELNDLQTAIEAYQNIPTQKRYHDSCDPCHLCEEACPNGINIIQYLKETKHFFDSELA